MVFLKVNELNGGEVIFNAANIEMITPITGGRAKIWFDVNDTDAMEVAESFAEVEQMLQVALIGNRGVVGVEDAFAGVK